MGQERVRISDIAEELGLSTATVSNVIHGKTKKISDRTVQKVQELLEERQYIPNMAGILLAQNDSKIVGVIINDHPKYEGHVLEDGFIAASVNGLAKELDEAGFFFMVKITTIWQDIPKFASMWNMAGLVLIGFCEADYQLLRNEIRVPFVIYDGNINDGDRLVNLTLDNFDGGRQIGEHFKELGHERILYISDNDIHTDHFRFLGLKSVFPEAEILIIPMEKEVRSRFYLENLDILRQYTAVFAASDYYAMDIMYFLHSQGIRVPEDMSVAGFDNNVLAGQLYPALTTIGQLHKKRAEMAVQILQKLREKEMVLPEYLLPVHLMRRESTGKVKGNNGKVCDS